MDTLPCSSSSPVSRSSTSSPSCSSCLRPRARRWKRLKLISKARSWPEANSNRFTFQGSPMKQLSLFFAFLVATVPCLASDPVALFYLTSGPDSIRSFLAHSTPIDLLVPTWYQVDENGLVTGAPDPTVLKRAGEDKVPLMPILAMFNKKGFHTLSMNPAAQALMNQAMVRECKEHGYIGFQF